MPGVEVRPVRSSRRAARPAAARANRLTASCPTTTPLPHRARAAEPPAVPRPGRRASASATAALRDRGRRRRRSPRVPARPARSRQDDARRAAARPPPAARRATRRSRSPPIHSVAGTLLTRLPAGHHAAVPRPASHGVRRGDRRRRHRASPGRVRSRSRTAESCSSTRRRSSPAACSTRCASRSRRARSASPGPAAPRSTRRASCWCSPPTRARARRRRQAARLRSCAPSVAAPLPRPAVGAAARPHRPAGRAAQPVTRAELFATPTHAETSRGGGRPRAWPRGSAPGDRLRGTPWTHQRRGTRSGLREQLAAAAAASIAARSTRAATAVAHGARASTGCCGWRGRSPTWPAPTDARPSTTSTRPLTCGRRRHDCDATPERLARVGAEPGREPDDVELRALVTARSAPEMAWRSSCATRELPEALRQRTAPAAEAAGPDARPASDWRRSGGRLRLPRRRGVARGAGRPGPRGAARAVGARRRRTLAGSRRGRSPSSGPGRPRRTALSVAGELGAGLADRGWAVVSGGAYGIDAAAHRGALAVERGHRGGPGLRRRRPVPARHDGLVRRGSPRAASCSASGRPDARRCGTASSPATGSSPRWRAARSSSRRPRAAVRSGPRGTPTRSAGRSWRSPVRSPRRCPSGCHELAAARRRTSW